MRAVFDHSFHRVINVCRFKTQVTSRRSKKLLKQLLRHLVAQAPRCPESMRGVNEDLFLNRLPVVSLFVSVKSFSFGRSVKRGVGHLWGKGGLKVLSR